MEKEFDKLKLVIEDLELFPGEDGDEDEWDIIFNDGKNIYNTVYLSKSESFKFIKNIDTDEYYNEQTDKLLDNNDFLDDLSEKMMDFY
jgi:hypothetical protein